VRETTAWRCYSHPLHARKDGAASCCCLALCVGAGADASSDADGGSGVQRDAFAGVQFAFQFQFVFERRTERSSAQKHTKQQKTSPQK